MFASKPLLRRFYLACDQIRTADLLLFRPRWWALHSRLICVAGRTDYCHAGMASRSDSGVVSCLEMVASGGRETLLFEQVEWYPGLIDVYDANPENRWPRFNRIAALSVMRSFVSRRYGWRNMVRVSLLHLPFVRLFVRPETDDQIESGRSPFCSHAVVLADRIGGGVDSVPGLADRLTEPGDLARSLFFKYRFTLIP